MPTSEEQQILMLLAKEWDYSGPPGIMDASDIVAALDQAPSATMQALKSLFEAGLVDMNVLKTSAFLTPEGMLPQTQTIDHLSSGGTETAATNLLGFAFEINKSLYAIVGWVEVRNPTNREKLNPTY